MSAWSPMSIAGTTGRLTAGALWLLVLGAVAYAAGGATAAFWWVVPAAIVWVISVRRAAAGAQKRAHGGLWFLASLFGPLSFFLLLVILRSEPAAALSFRTTEARDMGTDELLLRLAAVEDQVYALQREVDSIRSALGARAPVP